MKKQLSKVRDLHHLRRHSKNKPVFVVKKVNASYTDAVRKLQAEVYKYHGNVGSNQINEYGFLDHATDPYYANSQYFAATKKGDLLAGGRLILPANGYESLQISKELPVDAIRERYISSVKDGKVCEMSGLVKKPNSSRILPILLIKTMYDFAYDSGYEYIFMSVTKQPYKRFKNIFGSVLEELGEPYKIPHGNNIVYPVAIHTGSAKLQIEMSKNFDSYTKHLIKRLMTQ